MITLPVPSVAPRFNVNDCVDRKFESFGGDSGSPSLAMPSRPLETGRVESRLVCVVKFEGRRESNSLVDRLNATFEKVCDLKIQKYAH